jgi:transposase
VEGTSSHGTALNRHLTANGVAVIEVNRPDRAVRRRRGKTDAIDAENAARAVLTEQATAVAKSGDGVVEMIRLFKIAKDSATKARTQTINQLRAVLARAEPTLRETLAGLGLVTLVRRCADLADTEIRDIGGAATHVLRVLARRVQTLDAEIRSHQQHLTIIIESSAPELLRRFGVGPDTAAALLITAGDNPGRLTSEAAFAALCGVNPIEASSGKTSATGSTAAATAEPTAPSTPSCSPVWVATNAPATTPNAALPKESPKRTSSAASNATSPVKSSRSSPKPSHQPQQSPPRLDKHRGVIPFHPQLGVLGPQTSELGPLVAAQPLGLAACDLVLLDPVGQGSRMYPQVRRHLSDRFVGLADDPNSSLTELPVELPPLLGHDT